MDVKSDIMNEDLRKIIGTAIIIGFIVFAITSGFWFFIYSNTNGHSDVMTRCAIKSLDRAYDFALLEDWNNASKSLDVASSFLWRASWENGIATKKAWHKHIIALELNTVELEICLGYPHIYKNETIYLSFRVNRLKGYSSIDYDVSVENVTFAINITIGELLPYSDIDPAYPGNQGYGSNPDLWEKYNIHYKSKPSLGGGFRTQ